MSTSHLETNCLVIGAGTVGLAFADTLLRETDAHITIVHRRGKPGGHWNGADAFIALHQPSPFYGVHSIPLGSGRRDTVGLNRGLYERATGAEVVDDFDRVMNQRLLLPDALPGSRQSVVRRKRRRPPWTRHPSASDRETLTPPRP